jgi:hypothetical protein
MPASPQSRRVTPLPDAVAYQLSRRLDDLVDEVRAHQRDTREDIKAMSVGMDMRFDSLGDSISRVHGRLDTMASVAEALDKAREHYETKRTRLVDWRLACAGVLLFVIEIVLQLFGVHIGPQHHL